MNFIMSLSGNIAIAFLTIIATFGIIGISMTVQSMTKTLQVKNYSLVFNVTVGLGILAMFLSSSGTLLLMVVTGAIEAPIGFAIGIFIAYRKKSWCVAKINQFTTKVEQFTGN